MNKYIVIDCNEKEFNKIQRFMLDNGYCWISGNNKNHINYNTDMGFLINNTDKIIAIFHNLKTTVKKYPYYKDNYMIEKIFSYKQFMRQFKIKKLYEN